MKKNQPDKIFIIAVGILLLFGLLMLFSASSPTGYAGFKDPYFFIKRQIFLGLIPGLILFFICSRIDFNFWRRAAKPFFIFSLLLLVLVLIPGLGGDFGATKSWLVIGGQSFQPAELMKLALIIFLAAWLSNLEKEDFLNWRKGFLSFVLVIAAIGFLMMKQPDLGTYMILFMIGVSLYFVSGGELSHLVILFSAGLVGMVSLIFFSPYRLHRLLAFLNPQTDTLGISYHINQSLLAIGSGGFWGLGWGHSRQKFQYLPQVDADSIFAIIGEELGFLLSILFIGLLLFIFLRGLKIARTSSNRFGRLIVIGVMVWITGQALINIGAMVGVLPLTGVPLPLVSHGGTSMAMILAALGIVVNISKSANQE